MWPRRRPVPRVYSDTAHVRDPGLSLVVDDPSDDPTPPDSEEIVWQLAEKRGGELAMWKRTAEERTADLVEQCRANHGLRAENARLRSKLAEAMEVVEKAEDWRATGVWGSDADQAHEALISAIDARTSRLADGGTT